MQPELNLFQKGLILVSVPLLFELVFVAILAAMLQQAEHDIGLEVRARTIMGHLESINISLTNTGEAVTGYSVSKAPVFLEKFTNSTKTIPTELKALTDLTQGNKAELAVVSRCQKIVDELLAHFSKSIEYLRADEDMTAVGQLEDWKQLQEDFQKQSQRLMDKQERIVAVSPVSTAKAREAIKDVLMGGVLANIIIAFGLVLYFSKGTAARLQVVMDNTIRLSHRQALTPVLYGNDEIAQLDRFFHDMAERLAELDRLKQEFLAMISHDLRTPLMSIQFFLTTLKRGKFGELTPKGAEMTTLVDENAARLLTLVNELLDLDKLESGIFEMQFKDVAIAAVIARSVESVRAVADQRGVVIESPATQAIVHADEDRLVQVLVNLVGNAVKYSPPGEPVVVSVNEVSDWIEVRVTDKGRGVPAHLQAAIFERFKQVDALDRKQKGGSGLGLAIAKALVEQQGGEIGVDSEEGHGSSFWFRMHPGETSSPEAAR